MNREELITYIKTHCHEGQVFKDFSLYSYAELVVIKVDLELWEYRKELKNIKFNPPEEALRAV